MTPAAPGLTPAASEPSSLEVTFAGKRFACHDGDILGREGTAGAEIFRGLRAMSRRHLEVHWRKGAWQITLISTAPNETLLDGLSLPRNSPHPLGAGEHSVRIEGFPIDFHVGIGAHDAEAARATPASSPALDRLRDEIGEGNSLLSLVADNVADLIAIIDQNGQRLWNNAAYLTCLGYSPQEINASYSLTEVHPDDLPAVQRVFAESMRTLVGQRLEYRMRHREGHWVHLESQARVVAPAGGENKYLILVARDITERMRNEQVERDRMQRLADRANELSELTRSRAFQDGDQAACFAAVTEAAVEHLGCARAAVWLFGADGASLDCQDECEHGGKPHGCGARVVDGPAPGFFGPLRAERCLAIGEGVDDERMRDLQAGFQWPGATGSFLAARIGIGGDVLGALTLQHPPEADAGWSLEDQGFAASLADTLLMGLQAQRRAEAFAALQASQRQIADDLAEAANYVRALLPLPMTGGDVQSEWRLSPCSELGGDGLGHHWLDADHLAIYLIDSVGHGVSAALLAISVLNVLRSGSLAATDFHDPSQVLAGLNRTFQMETQNNMFFTAWYGVYHRPTRRIVYASAAHPPAVLLEGANAPALLGVDGLMIGADEATAFPSAEATIPPGGRLYVYSDGVFEIMRPDGTPWGFDAFLDCLSAPAADGGSELDTLRETVQRINGGPDLPDDFSVLRLTFS